MWTCSLGYKRALPHLGKKKEAHQWHQIEPLKSNWDSIRVWNSTCVFFLLVRLKCDSFFFFFAHNIRGWNGLFVQSYITLVNVMGSWAWVQSRLEQSQFTEMSLLSSPDLPALSFAFSLFCWQRVGKSSKRCNDISSLKSRCSAKICVLLCGSVGGGVAFSVRHWLSSVAPLPKKESLMKYCLGGISLLSMTLLTKLSVRVTLCYAFEQDVVTDMSHGYITNLKSIQ